MDKSRHIADIYYSDFLEPERIRELAIKAKGDDPVARNALVMAFLPLVRTSIKKAVAKPIRSKLAYLHEDMMSEGVFGVFDAIRNWRPDGPGAFSIAVFWAVRSRIWRWIHKNSKPVSGHKFYGETAVELDVVDWNTRDAIDPREDFTEVLDAQFAVRASQDALALFNEREQFLIQHRILDELDDQLTLQDVADAWGCSRERVRQVEDRVVKQFFGYMKAKCSGTKLPEIKSPKLKKGLASNRRKPSSTV